MSDRVYVWDKFIRVFHWSLVALFVVSYLTGENEHWLHIYSGYAIAILICLRVVWGVIGSKHAKFKDFIFSPGTIIQYVKDIASGNSKRYIGHNPLGGLMVVVLLITISTIVLSGMKLYAIEEGKGPFSVFSEKQVSMSQPAETQSFNKTEEEYEEGDDEDERHHYREHHDEESEEEEFWEELHELSINFMILLIILHIFGVLMSSRIEGESLVKAMISGYKDKQ